MSLPRASSAESCYSRLIRTDAAPLLVPRRCKPAAVSPRRASFLFLPSRNRPFASSRGQSSISPIFRDRPASRLAGYFRERAVANVYFQDSNEECVNRGHAELAASSLLSRIREQAAPAEL